MWTFTYTLTSDHKNVGDGPVLDSRIKDILILSLSPFLSFLLSFLSISLSFIIALSVLFLFFTIY